MAVWKVKRNRAAVLTGSLTVTSGSLFLDEILAGNGHFQDMPVSADVLLGKHSPKDYGEMALPPGHPVDWRHVSNLFWEMPGAPEPVDKVLLAPSDDAVLL